MDKRYFISHDGGLNQIPMSDATSALAVILVILVILSLVTGRRSRDGDDSEFLRRRGSLMLRGIAALCLLFGHFAITCLEGRCFFELGGRWAIVIFLSISGVAVVKTYGTAFSGRVFFVRRIRRLVIPAWICFAVFFLLDYMLLRRSYPAWLIVCRFMGVISPAPPNGSAWFVSYIAYLYFLYWFSCRLFRPNAIRILVLTLCSLLTSVAVLRNSWLLAQIGIWTQYTVVFPFAVAVGLHARQVKGALDKLRQLAPFGFLCSIVGLFLLYFFPFPTHRFLSLSDSWLFAQMIWAIHQLFLAAAFFMFVSWVDSLHVFSRFLVWVGEHSFEIMLVHLPFMVYYDFFLFRRPLCLYFPVFLAFVFAVSAALRYMTRKALTRVNLGTSTQ